MNYKWWRVKNFTECVEKHNFMCNLPFTKVRLAVQPLNQEILNLKDEELQGNVRKE